MKMKNTVLALVCLLAIILCCPLYAYAEDNTRFINDYSSSSEDVIQLYVSNVFDEVPEKDAITAELGSQPIMVNNISDSSSVPVLYYCLIDLSGSISKTQFTQETQALQAIANNMGKGDCMLIGSLGNSVDLTDKMSDKDKILKYIDSLKVGSEDTNLYKGIVDSLKDLANMSDKDDSHMQKCLVILSDGKDDQKTGITENEALDAAKNNHIPIFSIAVLPASPNKEQIEYAKVLGSFARNSAGGQHSAPIVDKIEASEAGQTIVNKMQSNLVLTFDISGVKAEAEKKDSLLFSVSVKKDSDTTYTDELTIPSSTIKFSEPVTEEVTTEEVVAESESDQVDTIAESEQESSVTPDNPKSDINKYLPFIIAALIIVIVICLILFLRNRKPEDDNDGGSSNNDNSNHGKSSDGESGVAVGVESSCGDGENNFETDSVAKIGGGAEIISSGEENKNNGSNIVTPPVFGFNEKLFSGPLMHISWVTINSPDNQVVKTSITPDSWHSFGRNNKSEHILNSSDINLSGINFYVMWSGSDNNKKRVMMYDRDSINGTFVNGVPIRNQGKIIVENGSTVRAGSFEYRMVIEDISS